MEETLREYELRNVYSYCELDDPKYQSFFPLRKEFNELDLNQRIKETDINYNPFFDERRSNNNRQTSRSQEKYHYI